MEGTGWSIAPGLGISGGEGWVRREVTIVSDSDGSSAIVYPFVVTLAVPEFRSWVGGRWN